MPTESCTDFADGVGRRRWPSGFGWVPAARRWSLLALTLIGLACVDSAPVPADDPHARRDAGPAADATARHDAGPSADGGGQAADAGGARDGAVDLGRDGGGDAGETRDATTDGADAAGDGGASLPDAGDTPPDGGDAAVLCRPCGAEEQCGAGGRGPAAPEACNGLDDDCDGATDEDFDMSADPLHCGSCARACDLPFAQPGCVGGECVVRECDDLNPCDGDFVCQAGRCCSEDHWALADPAQPGCSYACRPTAGDGLEACDRQDNDCDGATDEGFDLQRDPRHCGDCVTVCGPADCWAEPDGSFAARGAARCEQGRCLAPPPTSCGPYACRTAAAGAPASEPGCASTCVTDADCAPTAHCAAGACLVDLPPGARCGLSDECGAGLACVDGVCCTSACDGPCARCDLAGDGVCRPVGAGLDPDEECGALPCAGHFFGWEGASCHQRADVAAVDAGCDGAGACQGPAALCPLQTRGAPVVSCDPLCAEPDADSCHDATPPTCRPLDRGTTECGIGQCARSQPRCVGGAPVDCLPGPASPERCNDLDDDCDGNTDEDLAPASDPGEPSGDCAAPHELGEILEDDGEQQWSGTIDPQGDVDTYRFTAAEQGNFCLPFSGESYSLRARLVPPQGDDCRDYDLYLYDDACNELGRSRVAGCASDSYTFSWNGLCAVNDDRTLRVQVVGYAGATECVPYQLYLDMWRD